jgi:hypothetical protein
VLGDQSARQPTGRSTRGMSSEESGWFSDRQDQKSSVRLASSINESPGVRLSMATL